MKRQLSISNQVCRLLLLPALLLPVLLSGQVPALNSYPQARATIFIDFDGEEISGTAWNWNGPIVAAPSVLSQSAMKEIFERVAEDYRVFNINVTTDSTIYNDAPFNKRIRIIVTPSWEWYEEAGGVSYVGSFNWGNNTPAWAFCNLLSNQPKFIAEVISHETGHTLGLQHQSTYSGSCVLINEYCEGQGTGETSWAPIMGNGYYRNVTTWNNGPSTVACGIWQNDIQVIAGPPNDIGFRDDEHSDEITMASPIFLSGVNVASHGMINYAGDKDFFRLTVPVTSPVKLNLEPLNVGASNAGANVDLKLTLHNEMHEIIYTDNPDYSLGASLDTFLSAGIYYLMIEGTANENVPEYGSLGFYNLTGSVGSVLPVHRLQLNGKKSNNRHELTWTFVADERIAAIEIESSSDGIKFNTLASVNSATSSFLIKNPLASAWYRIRVLTESGNPSVLSNVVFIQELKNKQWSIQNNIVRETLELYAGSDGNFELLDINGRVLTTGKLSTGNNHIPISHITKGFLFLRVHGNNQVQTFKLIKS
ncbi:MAG TPA: zinc-dependent metalloprotease [Flavitalea sp.]|nr:zinc-dependent metalloprotease [Flavitalea sp.]